MPLVDLIDDEMETADIERAKMFKAAWEIYDGKHPDSLPTTRGVSGKPDVNDNVKYNLSRLTVDKGVSFLMGGLDQEIKFQLEEQPGDGDPGTQDPGSADQIPSRQPNTASPDEEWLESTWGANQKKTVLSDIATNGGVCGHYFVRLYEDGAVMNPELPRMVNLDPAYVTPIWKEDDYQIVLGYKIQFPTRGKRVRRTLIEPDVQDIENFDPRQVERWMITDQVADGTALTANAWSTQSEEIWDHPFSPVIDGKNLPSPNMYWGYGDLEGGLIEMNLSINRALSSMQRILRLHGHPKPWVAGVTPDQIQLLIQGVDRIITLPVDAELKQLEMSGDLSPMVEFYRQLKSAFHEQAHNPQVEPEKLGSAGSLSGLALKILYQPLLEQTGTKRGTYGDFLLELNRRLLVLGGIQPSPVSIAWPDPLPMDIKETTDALVAQRELGLSQETALERLGEDPGVEEERRNRDSVSLGAGLGGILGSPAFNGGTGA
jgi:hypothetical protein